MPPEVSMPKKTIPIHLLTLLLAMSPMSMLWSSSAHAQQVSPVIQEYRNRGEGKLTVTNNTLEPMIVIFEPKSFSISPDGHGIFRALDPTTHVSLSEKSVKLQPLQSSTIYYKAEAESYPAWFTIYSTFSPARAGSTLNVRIQLPHTVYLYQNKAIDQNEVHIVNARYSLTSHKLTCDMLNVGRALTRVQELRATGTKTEPMTQSGFPLLPGALRTVEFDWKGKEPPTNLEIAFDHFTLKPPLSVVTDPPPSAAPPAAPAGTPPTAPAPAPAPGATPAPAKPATVATSGAAPSLPPSVK
jgi:hypothetical protein